MKPNKRRIDIRLKKSLFERITSISDKLEKTWTDVIEESLAYGLKWYEAKIKRELAQQKEEAKPVQTQENNTPDDEDDDNISEEELNKKLDALYKMKGNKIPRKINLRDCQEYRLNSDRANRQEASTCNPKGEQAYHNEGKQCK